MWFPGYVVQGYVYGKDTFRYDIECDNGFATKKPIPRKFIRLLNKAGFSTSRIPT